MKLPEVINVGNPYNPQHERYMLKANGQEPVLDRRGHQVRIGDENVFKVWVDAHGPYPKDVIPEATPVEQPLSGRPEDLLLIAARLNSQGEVVRARVVRPTSLPSAVRRRAGVMLSY